MSLRLRFSFGLLALLAPAFAFAAPGNVTGIEAVEENGGVRVTWQQVSGDIAEYRIFYGQISILGNQGLFDDFETADGSINSFLLQNLPPYKDLYVSILAVDPGGVESPFFMEEAHVVLSQSGAPAEDPFSQDGSVPSPVEDPAVSASEPLATGETTSSPDVNAFPSSATLPSAGGEQRLLRAEAVSSTGVLLVFAQHVTIAEGRAAGAITITTGSGIPLQLRRLVLEGPTVIVHTEPQERGIAYRVTLNDAIGGTVLGGAILPLASDQLPMLFLGHETGKAPSSGTTKPAERSDILNLRLRAQAGTQGYTVEATWQQAQGDVIGYNVAQSQDGGKTFAAASRIQPDANSVRIPDVPGGITFGLKVQAAYADGSFSQGMAQLIELPKTGPSLPGDVTQPSGGGKLPSSGAGAVTLAVIFSSIGGAYAVKRERMAAA